MKKLTALLLAVVMVFTLAACQKKTVAGTYKLTQMIENGTTTPMNGEIVITLNEDNTGTYGEGGFAINWTQDGDTLTFTAVEEGPTTALVLTISGNTLTTVDGSTEMTFTKQ